MAPTSNHYHNHSTHHHATTIPTTKTHADNLRWNPCRQPPRETHVNPNPHNPQQTQTKPKANLQPNTDLHTTPKYRSLRQTRNVDLHSTTLICNKREKRNNEWVVACHGQWQWVRPWCGGYGVLSLKRGSEWGLKGERESEIERQRERHETESGGEWKWQIFIGENKKLLFCFRMLLQYHRKFIMIL